MQINYGQRYRDNWKERAPLIDKLYTTDMGQKIVEIKKEKKI
jgi:hypothetical protein